jgi:hypothetical protein
VGKQNKIIKKNLLPYSSGGEKEKNDEADTGSSSGELVLRAARGQ